MALNFPANPVTNDTYISPDGKTYSFDGVKWVYKPEGVGTNVIISLLPPDSANDGQLWWNSESGQLFVYYTDGTSNQWVSAVPVGDSSGLPDQSGANGKYLRTDGSGVYWDYSVRPIVYAPSLAVTGTESVFGYDYTQPITVSTSAFSVYSTSNIHAYTDWWVVDHQGKTVFESKNDTVNLSSITIPGNTLHGVVTCYVIHVNNEGVKSSSSSVGITFNKAAGGTFTSEGGYFYHTFTESGVFEVFTQSEYEVFIIAGGGGSRTLTINTSTCAGGGGAGGLIQQTLFLNSGEYPIAIGAGGSVNTNGSDTVFSDLIALGGGAGGERYANGNNGGCGGGSGYLSFGIGSQGGDGGNDAGNSYIGGGGGGVASDGSTPGPGGEGILINGNYYGGGGGGGHYTTIQPGGLGGGGNGGIKTIPPTNGAVNTGGGGGGNSSNHNGAANVGALGGSGLVIIRYV